MFGISFGELLLIGLVALLVLGPERLPGAARTAGRWIGKIRHSFNSIKSEVEREIGADEFRRQMHDNQFLSLEKELRQSIQDVSQAREPRQDSPAGDSPAATTPATPDDDVKNRTP